MNDSVLKEAIVGALRELEQSGDIVISTSIPNDVVKKLMEAVQSVSPNLLSADEYSAIINAANLTWSGFYVDDWDFQTHVSLTREQLGEALKKMGKPK